MTRVGILGAGSWGTALAALVAKKGHDVHLWAIEPQVVNDIRGLKENRTYLPGIRLPQNLQVTNDLKEALADAVVVVSVSPSQFVASVMDEAAQHIKGNAIIVIASKGIEIATLRRMDEVMESILTPEHLEGLCVLSGPSFAMEVAEEMPTAVVVASASAASAAQVQSLFQTNYFRVYTGNDVVGVELGGALKNVIALAAGVVVGLGYEQNTVAALITRGLAEMRRLGVAMGAEASTFSGLAGIGDLVLTCTGSLSRNRGVGYRLGQGETLEEILEEMSSVAEGVKTVQAVHDLAERYGVEMPISEEVYGILVQGADPEQALQNLMQRDPKPEEWY